MAMGGRGFTSCTPGGIMRLLEAYRVDLAGQRAVVIGRSPILGRPVGMLLLARDATVTYCHSKTADLAAAVAAADIVVAAVGRPELVEGAWIKPGAAVIVAGYNPGNIGDVEYGAAAQRARLITPVPGGVGPTIIAVLLAQTVDAAESAAHDPGESGVRVTVTSSFDQRLRMMTLQKCCRARRRDNGAVRRGGGDHGCLALQRRSS